MPSDRSRPPDPASDAYTGVVMQQGRVLLDRDFNAQREIADRRDALTTRDVIGPCGTPDDGFAISAPQLLSPPALGGRAVIRFPPIQSPPGASYDLLIRSGTMFLGGVRVAWPGNADGSPREYDYDAQPDWLAPDPPAAPATEIVWLLVEEREVSATEDPDLLDVALGGPDTTQRLRLLRTVHRSAVRAAGCAPAWQALLSRWQAAGWDFDPATMRRMPQARMQVAFTAPVTTIDPCDPIATGGYLGAENQLIRVKWSPPQAGATSGTLIWSYDDSSFLYRATSDQTGTRLTLSRNPPDAYHFPGTGQYVEVLRTTARLGSGATGQAEDGGGMVPRCIAEENGFVTALAAAYDPTSSDRALVLGAPLPPAYRDDPQPLFVRIWQGGAAMAPGGGTVELVDPVANASTGLTVTVSVPGGVAIAPGSFWMMALRPGTPQAVLPAGLLAAPQPPDGPRSRACPLAVVEWPDGGAEPVIHDCRVKFDDLIALTQRPWGCCTVSVTPADITADRTLQATVGGMTGPGTLCLGPGNYALTAPLTIGAGQAGLTIVAENGATLTAAPGAEAAFADGMIVVAGAAGVTLRGLTLIPPATPVAPDLFTGLGNLSRLALTAAQQGLALLLRLIETDIRVLRTMIGVRAAGAASLTLDRLSVRFAPPTGDGEGSLFGIGLLAGGACAGLTVRDCTFDASALAPTQTPALLQTTGFLGPLGFVLEQRNRVPGMQGAIGCLAAPYVRRFLAAAPGAVAVAGPDARDVFTTVADLTGAIVRDNLFDSMTVAISALGMLDGVRIEGNSVRNGGGGFWLRPIEEARFAFTTGETRDPVVAGDSLWLKLVLLQRETFLTWLLSLLLPPPADSVIRASTASGDGASLRIAGNHVAALASAGALPWGMPALAVVSGTSPPGIDVGPGLTVAGNRLQARTAPNYPAAMLAVSGRLAATGNLISNEPSGSPPASTALLIFPNDNGRVLGGTVSAPHIAVTGNVLEGGSNLGQLIRSDPFSPPFNTWLPFNASS